ncbi:hypothetical protein L0128_21665 [candidate division KSB1 bacterium]|nr:hypothetical protein [candidate division KSB1 bacterium]
MRQKAEKLIKELQEFIGEALYAKDKEDLFFKIEQLKAVHESIEQLEAKNVLVPDDLRRIKSELLSETGKNREFYEALSYLAVELKKIEKDLSFHLSGKKTRKTRKKRAE